MRSNAFFRYVIHTARTYLHLYPPAAGPHYCGMQGLVPITLRHTYPVPQPVGAGAVKISYYGINFPAVFLFFFRWGIKNYSYGENIIHLLEGYILGTYLVPYRMYRLGP